MQSPGTAICQASQFDVRILFASFSQLLVVTISPHHSSKTKARKDDDIEEENFIEDDELVAEDALSNKSLEKLLPPGYERGSFRTSCSGTVNGHINNSSYKSFMIKHFILFSKVANSGAIA